MDIIRNFVQIKNGIGTGGQPTSEQFQLIADNGYKHVVNLAMPDNPDAIANEGELVTAYEMNYIHIPVPYEKPTPRHVRQFCKIISALEGEKIFVHCVMNYRVSVFMYHYLTKVEKLSELESRSSMFECWQPNEVWEKALNWSVSEIEL